MGVKCVRMEEKRYIERKISGYVKKAAGMYLRHGFRYTGKQWMLRDGLWEREMIRSAV